LSPLVAVSKQTPPTLIVHSDADPLVPYEQSERFVARLAENGVPHQLVTRKGAGHFRQNIGTDATLVADWFDKYLVTTVGHTGPK
jgi:dipeptidyl aminopeptidase/acylaminoacyl peptidase